jgi:RNA polymerase sigma-70 factor (ECF subfamily)
MLCAGGEGRVLRQETVSEPRLRLPLGVPQPAEAIALDPGTTEAAWTEFQRRLRRFVARRLLSPADAEDVVQQVFLKLHQSLGSLQRREALAGWLHRAARNAIADHYRSPARRRESPAGDAHDLDGRLVQPAQDAGESTGGCADCLRPLLLLLPPAHRRALEQVDLHGLSQAAAARAAGVTVSGMKSRVQRARRRLRSLVLDRCRVSLDRRGGVTGCEPRGASRPCSPGPPMPD